LVDAVEAPRGARLDRARLHHAVLFHERDARVVGELLGLERGRLHGEAAQRVLVDEPVRAEVRDVHHLGGELGDARQPGEGIFRAAHRVLAQHDDVRAWDRPWMLSNRPGLHDG
jgi:hypothetical protein